MPKTTLVHNHNEGSEDGKEESSELEQSLIYDVPTNIEMFKEKALIIQSWLLVGTLVVIRWYS